MEKTSLKLEVEHEMDTHFTLQYSKTTIIDANGRHPGEPQCVVVLEDFTHEEDVCLVACLTVRQIPKLILQLNQMMQRLLDD